MVCQCRVSQEGVDLETKLTNAEVSRKNHQTFAESGVDLSETELRLSRVHVWNILGNPGPITCLEDVSKF